MSSTTYIITTITGNASYAGTGGKIHITLYGNGAQYGGWLDEDELLPYASRLFRGFTRQLKRVSQQYVMRLRCATVHKTRSLGAFRVYQASFRGCQKCARFKLLDEQHFRLSFHFVAFPK